ncbi:hypothetical protein U1Q18_013263 [Sarracenia purpurea var. burkii]
MATDLPSSNQADEEEDYIDMEVTSPSSSSSSFLCYSIINSPPTQAIEFEFQMSSAPNDREPSPSPADELFYKGKLLPLHLPPRLQMVQNLLQNSNKTAFESYTIPFITATAATTTTTTTTATPLESCNISPSESRRVSSELNPDEYFFEWSTELSGFINSDNNNNNNNNQKKYSWSEKLKLIKQSILGQKLKVSKAYFKTLFTKSGCSVEESVNDSSKGKECSNKFMKVEKKDPFGKVRRAAYPTLATVMKSFDREVMAAEDAGGGGNGQRKSFSGAIKRSSTTTKTTSSSSSSSSSGASSLSSSFSINSNGFYELQFLKRSSSASSEIERSIESAIAHCKKSSQQVFMSSSKASSEVCSVMSASRIAVSEDKER